MPELTEVLEALPDGRLLINFENREMREGHLLAALVAANPDWRDSVWGAYGGDEPTYRAADLIDGLAVWSRRSLVDCLLRYEALGWTGFMPRACRNTKAMVPLNLAPFLWDGPISSSRGCAMPAANSSS